MNPIPIIVVLVGLAAPVALVPDHSLPNSVQLPQPLTLFVGNWNITDDNVSLTVHGHSLVPLNVSIGIGNLSETENFSTGDYVGTFVFVVHRVPGCIAETFQIVATNSFSTVTDTKPLTVCGEPIVPNVNGVVHRFTENVPPVKFQVVVENVVIIGGCCGSGNNGNVPSVVETHVVSTETESGFRASLLGHDVMLLPVKLPSVNVSANVVGQNVIVGT